MKEYFKENYLRYPEGIKSWIYTLDHKRIGLMYLFAIFGFFILAGFTAVFMRYELMSAEAEMSEHSYNVLMTLHGAVMVFMFIIPSIPAALGNIMLPIMIGAKDVAFPRLNLASWYVYLAGSAFGIYSIVSGGADTGWTFYTPYSTTTNSAVFSMTMAAFILGFSSIFTGINFIVTIHNMRMKGMTWGKLPLFVWGLYATALIQVLATPVIAITLLLLIMERAVGIGIFDPALGGDPVLFQHFFWFYSHPAVYIMIVPGLGVISELISTFSKKKIFGYKFIAGSSMAIAFLGFLVWGHHMFVSTQSAYASLVFSFITFFVGVPTGIKVFSWLATLYKGNISLKSPMLYALMFLITFTIGGLTGIFLGALSVDIHLTDTYFVVAHFHYVMMGGTVVAFLGAVHYWWPKIWGRLYNEFQAKIAALLVFVGFNLTFFPQFILGSLGMPRRYAQYAESAQGVPFEKRELFEFYHSLSTYGTWVLVIGFILIAYYLIRSVSKGKVAGSNPWGSLTMEWEVPSPVPPHNFLKEPVFEHGPYDYDKVIKQKTIDE
ncbi:MAG: cytochrome c oxidase subunit I [Pelagibacteraceae bacterium TMED124]|nr:cytochrome c oxidase subunit I [Candidatus Neomarinimicrobiota bacterium]RPG18580.1 MAG: cytochrome c oxidase subunit I [Pelagibacteraceae bacterium TMED124]|tara:strand:- start:3521 stop:5164 length:1644 start_codon:yes stop_codon:yes gene_type:complete